MAGRVKKLLDRPLSLSLAYVVVSIFWIIFSDRFLSRLVADPDRVLIWGTVKGLGFVSLSALLIYILLRRLTSANRILESLFAVRTQALRKSEARYASLLQTAQEGVWVLDSQQRTESLNQRMAEMLKCPAEAIIGKEIFEFVAPQSREDVARTLQKVSTGFSQACEIKLLRQDGTELWALPNFSPLWTERGEYNGAMCLVSNIEEQKSTEALLELQATALHATANSIVITDAKGDIVWTNPAFTELTGYDQQEVLGKNPRLLKSGRQRPELYRDLWNMIRAGHTWHGELTNRRKDGTLYERETTISPVRSASGEITHFVAINQDLTERKSLELQLRQAQKLEAIGRLAGGVAHDFNNMLGVILGHGDMLQTQIPPDHPATQEILEMQKAARRAADLTRQLLAFSRKQALQPQVLNPNSLIADLGKMLRRVIGETIEFDFRPGKDVARIKVDPGQLEQIVMNLAVNAKDAMPGGGRLIVETKNVKVDNEFARTHLPMRPGPYVMLSVSDNGSGMDNETLSHIFEPFFTTKEQGKGTGLGLSIVYGIVKQSGGFIWVDSQLNHGSIFRVYLPPTTEAETATIPLPSSTSLRGTETILVVEDETSLREMIRMVLTSNGYHVLEASNASEALSILQSHAEVVHLAIIDIALPGSMNGLELAQALGSSIRPGMRTLFMTGFAGEIHTFGLTLPPEVALITKPFSTDLLLHKIRDVLDGERGKSAAVSL